ncbi:hypothetical protein N8944_02075 [Pseudomonadales bacterium]|nr:hypothetical protein [Pseudomonadales bacterium]MDA8702722.1 hypothetical protein [Pseudomonadales bacterium]MDB0050986.1 hypothetical protein [Pseudomonadales bacterium]
MQAKHWVNLGYFFIWGDFYLVLFAVHAVVVAPISFELYLSNHLQAGLQLFDWIRSLNGFLNTLITFFYGLPAIFIFASRFVVSTSIGIWMVRKGRSINSV